MKDLLPRHLPDGWKQLPLELLVTRMSNGITKRQTKDGKGFPVSRIETISQGVIDFNRVGYLAGLTDAEVDRYRLESGDLLFSHINSDLHLGKTAVFSIPGETLLHGMNLLLIRIDREKLLPVFLHWFFNYCRAAGVFMSIAQHAVNQSSINQKKLNTLPIVVPPPSEQRRIVAEIEKQFTRLDAGVAALRRVQANLKRYRAAVLKAACEGRLVPTEVELSKTGRRKPKFESGEALLARILTERRQNWQGRGQFKESFGPETIGLPQLSDGWAYCGIEPLLDNDAVGIKTGPFGSLLKKHEHVTIGDPVIGIENIGANGRFTHGSKIRITGGKAAELAAYDIQPGDVVISRSGTVGELCVVPDGLGQARFSTNIMRVRIASSICDSRFFCFLFSGSPLVLGQVEDLCKGSTRSFLNQHILKAIVFPLPPVAEQTRIVAEVERRLSVIEELEKVISANLQRATRLRQSILQKAFTGALV